MIKIYEKVLSKNICEYLMKRFDGEQKDKSHKMFDQIEITHWKEQSQFLLETTNQIAKDYYECFDPHKLLPKRKKIESFRIKRYEPNQHCFPLHVDANSVESCTRFIAFLYYLNDNEAGTKFHFLDNEFTSESKQGNVLVFPPLWTYPHEGLMPTKTPKYIMSTYYHYV